MTVYLLEAYLPGSNADDLVDVVERLRKAADTASQGGLPVRYLRLTYVPEDETCFHYVEAPTAAVAMRFAQRAQLPFDRIVETRNAAVSTASDPKEGR